jgi:predicted RNase H-like HicB family nuclease
MRALLIQVTTTVTVGCMTRHMAERHIISQCADGKWSAAYSDRPEERFYGATMDEAIDRLKQASSASEASESSTIPIPDPPQSPEPRP